LDNLAHDCTARLQNTLAGIDPDNIRKGERLTFDVESAGDGKIRASNVRRAG
jgi:hypothetical protein